MPDEKIPQGQLFSRVYLKSGGPTSDSTRFRKRLGSYLEGVLSSGYGVEKTVEFAGLIQRELGMSVPGSAGYFEVVLFFEKATLRDLLDSITLTVRFLDYHISIDAAVAWYEFVKRTLREENLGYRLDPKGGVHYFVDDEFERNRVSALSCLSDPKYRAVLVALEGAFQKLDANPPDTKGAVRDTFEAAETLFKLLTGSGKSLDEAAVKKDLWPKLAPTYQEVDPIAGGAAEQLIHGFCQWVNAGHKYRHGQRTEEPVEPPIGMAVLYLSTGAAYIRWLVGHLGL